MPHGNDPNYILLDPIEKTVWRYDHLPEGKFRKFRHNSTGFQKILKPSQDSFRPLSKSGRR